MILLFKRNRAYKIALEVEPKPAEPAYLKKLTKIQFKDRLITAQAASSVSSTTLTPQSRESTTTAGAQAPQPPPVILLS